MKIRNEWICLGFAFFAACVTPDRSEMHEPDMVEIEAGVISGVMQGDVVSFKGVPFAKAPIGDLRWRAPQVAERWTGVLEATEYAPDCMQVPFAGDAAPLRTTPSEDCLYLNVWKPASAKPGEQLPVIVWIYGGGWVNGGSSPAVYEGTRTAMQGAVFVSFNYRLGRFGFFAHPALTEANEDNGLLGNYGYMDQLAVLEWIQNNIESFGGDAENVTIMGESAGGGAVLNLLTISRAEGLFHRALAMSAPARHDSSLKPLQAEDRPDAEGDGQEFAIWAGVRSDDTGQLSSLRALPAEIVAAGTGMANTPVAPSSGPMIDGTMIVGADTVLAGRNQISVPTMAGAVSDDIGFGPEKSPGDLFLEYPDPDAARLAYSEFEGSPADLRKAIYADRFMQEPARFTVEAQSETGAPAYYYRYGYIPESKRGQWVGMPHANEIPFFLNTVQEKYGEELTGNDEKAAELMSTYLVNFARSGDPNGPGLPDWPAYDGDSQVILRITESDVIAGPDPLKLRLDVNKDFAESNRAMEP